ATLNIDLIYGAEFQTVESWMRSVRRALAWEPEEIYLYPLFVRPLTGLAGRSRVASELALACYRAAREALLTAGVCPLSLRALHAHVPQARCSVTERAHRPL